MVDNKENDDESGAGGRSGEVKFRGFVGTESLRDDLLPPDEKRRLLAVHRDGHENRVKKQKELRDQRQQMKEGKIPLSQFRESRGNGMNSAYRAHPILSDKAQFSGIDPQVNVLPSDNIANTNEADRNELENQYRLTHAPEFTPKFNPKPLPR